ncbi:hypothetical protein [Mesorhizobium huakuii]|uniref:Uncharacterized protein n=1 Tax=Mesorhizobium huakuii TaxID=28104 RepID=A0ABZ0VHN6_9HYPH|nr:hypothetical protein [Mesorhizobium huakuii]WQB96327.1 hypothetical protein U0R22_000379 [Mesorhizobium huakuii]
MVLADLVAKSRLLPPNRTAASWMPHESCTAIMQFLTLTNDQSRRLD